MSKPYHINPDTGNANVCGAKYNCRFGDRPHYESKEEAVQASEHNLEAEQMDAKDHEIMLRNIGKANDSYDDDNREFNGVDYAFQNIRKFELSDFTNEDRENYLRAHKIAELMAHPNPSQKSYDEAEMYLRQMNTLKRSRYASQNPQDEFGKLDRNILNLSKGLIALRKGLNRPSPEAAPEREKNTRLIGDLEGMSRKLIGDYNDRYGTRGRKQIGESAIANMNETLNRIQRGDRSLNKYEDPENRYYLPNHDLLLSTIENDSQMYLATAWPDNELRSAMDRADLKDVSVSSFDNNREYGNTYSVIDKNGDTRTFSVYEHRNSDSIIINGKTNFDPSQDDVPYVADSKNAFFAEFAEDDRQQAAETLTYFLKSAQKGELESDNELARKAQKRDWGAILTRQIPGFGEWLDKNDPEGVERRKRDREDPEGAIFRRLQGD